MLQLCRFSFLNFHMTKFSCFYKSYESKMLILHKIGFKISLQTETELKGNTVISKTKIR